MQGKAGLINRSENMQKTLGIVGGYASEDMQGGMHWNKLSGLNLMDSIVSSVMKEDLVDAIKEAVKKVLRRASSLSASKIWITNKNSVMRVKR